MTASVEWWLTAYGHDESLAGEWRLEGVNEDQLRDLFDLPDDEQMVGLAYQVSPPHVARLQSASGHALELARFDYFVGAR